MSADASQVIPAAGARRATVIRPRGASPWDRLFDLFRYRDLLILLAVRDLKVRYKQTVLGAAWAVLQPLVTMVVLHLFFGQVLGVAERVGSAAYPVFLYAGLAPWMLFAAATTATSQSLVNEAGLLRKVYFPRLVLPIAALGAPLVDYLIASVVLFGLMAWFGVAATWQVVLLPIAVVSVLIAVVGMGVTLAGLTVRFRDVRHVVPFLVQTLFFLTPVIYPVTILPTQWRWLIQLNPMAGTIEACRGAILGTPIDYAGWALSTTVGALLCVVGVAWFIRAERRFADIV